MDDVKFKSILSEEEAAVENLHAVLTTLIQRSQGKAGLGSVKFPRQLERVHSMLETVKSGKSLKDTPEVVKDFLDIRSEVERQVEAEEISRAMGLEGIHDKYSAGAKKKEKKPGFFGRVFRRK